MGIRNLNRFLKENASGAITLCNLSDWSGRVIAIDASIYLYRYATDGTLIENIYLMVRLFQHYQIVPLFVFDGKPPPEKQSMLWKRKCDKKQAEQEYTKLKQLLEQDTSLDIHEQQELSYSMDALKKKFVTLNKDDIDSVKRLIEVCGASYCDAPGEADVTCAMLTVTGKVWACLSEDTDMFVYGCPRVIRYLSLLNHTAVMYDVPGILQELGISQKELREICVLSGTDYNVNGNRDLATTLKLFKKYHRAAASDTTPQDFYDWVQLYYPNYAGNLDTLRKVCDMFALAESPMGWSLMDDTALVIRAEEPNREEVMRILEKDGFLFPPVPSETPLARALQVI